MCYFHVRRNFKKHKNLIKPKSGRRKLRLQDFYNQFKHSVDALHMCATEADYKVELAEFTEQYKRNAIFGSLFKYFEEQWLVSAFNRWQIFRNHPGYPNTKSNIESFNAIIKRDFTERIRLSIANTIRKIMDILIFYSSANAKEFSVEPKFYAEIRDIKVVIPALAKKGPDKIGQSK